VGLIHVEQEKHAAIGIVAKIAFLRMQLADFGSAIAALGDRRTSTRIAIRILHTANHYDFAVGGLAVIYQDVVPAGAARLMGGA